MSTIIYFIFPAREGAVPICVLEDNVVIGWTSADNPSDVEYRVWDYVEKRARSESQ
jgi:hypothetical protein